VFSAHVSVKYSTAHTAVCAEKKDWEVRDPLFAVYTQLNVNLVCKASVAHRENLCTGQLQCCIMNACAAAPPANRVNYY
jgi:hypothetical protein